MDSTAATQVLCLQKKSRSELLTVRKFTLTEEICTNFLFSRTEPPKRWETVEFSNSKRDLIWRSFVLQREVLAKDTTRRNVSVCSCPSLNRLHVWVRFVSVNEGMNLCRCVFLSVALYHWSQRVSQNVVIFLWWQFYNQYDGPISKSKVPSLFTFTVCFAADFHAPGRKWNLHLLTKRYQASLVKQYT